MNSAGVVDSGGPNGSPDGFNPHDPNHFPPELTYPGPPFGQPPPSAATVGGGNPNVDGRRLNVNAAPIHQRASRKRKSPPDIMTNTNEPPGFTQAEFPPQGVSNGMSDPETPGGMSHTGRPLNPGKRAEQNRKAQRAFRERRELHVKELEARSQLLDAALASADEANRRWEECRTMLDQLRVENASLRNEINNLRAALGNAVSAAQFQQHVQQQQAGGSDGNGGQKDGKDD